MNHGFEKGEAPNTGSIPVVRNIFDVSAEFLGQYKTWLEQNPPSIPVTQILGFTGFTFQPATTISTGQATTSTTYADLATVGPSLQGLSKGKYAIFFGAQGQPTSPTVGLMSLTVTNVAAATDTDSIVFAAGANMSASRVVLKDLAQDGANGVAAQYRSSDGGSVSFSNRWLIAVKYSNL